MRVAPLVLALSLGLLGASAPVPPACELDLVVAETAHPKVHDAARVLASRLTEHGVEATATTAVVVPADDQLVDLSRLRPGWWPRSDTVHVVTGPSARDDELGRFDGRAGEIRLNADRVGEDLFPTSVWQEVLAHELGHLAGLAHADGGVMATELPVEQLRLTDAHVAQVAAAWCGRPAPGCCGGFDHVVS